MINKKHTKKLINHWNSIFYSVINEQEKLLTVIKYGIITDLFEEQIISMQSYITEDHRIYLFDDQWKN